MRRTLALVALALTTVGAQAAQITLTGTIRDFKGANEAGGHPDFEYTIVDQPGAVQSTLVGGKPALLPGAINTGSFHTQADFAQWYTDVPGVNQSKSHSITLDDAGHPGIFTYTNNNFFPIDGELFGNTPGQGHNYHFTYELHTTFGFQGGEVFTFSGDDDVWVFVNGKLAIDLGGVHSAKTATLTLDAPTAALYGLTAGNNYTLDFFFAERHTTQSNFSIATTLPLVSQPEVPEPTTYALMGCSLAALGLIRRFKKA